MILFLVRLNPLESVNVLKDEMERLRLRIARAERAAERDYLSDSDSHLSSVANNTKTVPLKAEKGKKFLSRAQTLYKKRMLERKRKKAASCILEHVGPSGTVKSRRTGVANKERRVFDIQCPECPLKSSRLHSHLESVHKYTSEEAKFKESEVRVMYLWAKKEKHGIPKPLPCELCFTWHLRLDNHIKYSHKDMDQEKCADMTKMAREKYWTNSEVAPTINRTSNEKQLKKIPALKFQPPNSDVPKIGANYIPSRAKTITNKDTKGWHIEGDDFLIYYTNAEDLLNAFVEEMSRKHPQRRALNYRAHLEYIWDIVDQKRQLFPKCAFSNSLLVEDRYHNVTLELVGKGGNEASTLRVRFTALRYFIKFLRRRHVYAGLDRNDFNRLLEYIDDWNNDFTKLISQRRTDIRRVKVKRLMTPTHMIKYGTSAFIQSLGTQANDLKKGNTKITKRYAQQYRDFILTNTCLMNGCRASNIIELRVTDVKEAVKHPDYPGYMSFINSTYKTSTIYGEKVMVLPDNLFVHMMFYVNRVRGVLSSTKQDYLFVVADSDQMSHGSVGSALTSSFSNAGVFTTEEYTRVSPTRIRCACATFGCKIDGIDSGYFAKHFMKNKEDTTQMHYNLYANHREALKLAMLIGDTFEVGGVKKVALKADVEKLTCAIYKSEKVMPERDEILSWINKNNSLDSKELAAMMEILDTVPELERSADQSSAIPTPRFYPKKKGNEEVS